MNPTSRFAILLGVLALGLAHTAFAQERIANGGFEQVEAGQPLHWSAYEQGFAFDATTAHRGSSAVRCASTTPTEQRGVMTRLRLDQRVAEPVVLSGWSRAENVSGMPTEGYALYVDVDYADGTHLWGQVRPFATGTHDWEQRTLRLFPARPIRQLTLYGLFRGHTGTVWFDDFSAVSIPANRSFDGQTLAPPHLAAGVAEGWFARDVAKGGAIVPLEKAGLGRATLRKGAVQTERITDKSGTDRVITVYYVRKVAVTTPVWWNDIGESYPARDRETANWTGTPFGAVGAVSQYPLGCVTGDGAGEAVGIPPGLGPRIARIGFHPTSRLLYVAFDLALTVKAGDGKRSAEVAVARWSVDPAWGFRDAVRGYYRLFHEAVRRRTVVEGIWMPFTDPATVEKVEDFGVAFHEGDNNVAGDDGHGILSFRYSEPMTYWMDMPTAMPRTYTAAADLLQQQAAGTTGSPQQQRQARAVVQSGAQDASGRYQGEFRDTPWSNGIAWVLNPNPELAGADTKAKINFDVAEADRQYTAGTMAGLDGEYLDSVESWADVPDFRPESLRSATIPPTFTPETHQPVLPTWFGVWEFSRWLSDDLHRRGKLLMGNTVPVRFFAFAPLFDVMGIETNWIAGERWRPDDEATQRLRRTLSGTRPYLLLMNTEFDKLTYERVEAYFRECLSWGVYPSMFSADAATSPYWESKARYDRDRPLFRKYIPRIRELSRAGWEPVPYARSENAAITIERFGNRYLTLRNTSDAPVTTRVRIEIGRFLPAAKGRRLIIADGMEGSVAWQGPASPSISLPVTLPARGVSVLHLSQGKTK